MAGEGIDAVLGAPRGELGVSRATRGERDGGVAQSDPLGGRAWSIEYPWR